MEAKVIDFKQPLESHLGKINKVQETKTKDFSSTLNSVNKKPKFNVKDSSKVDKKEVKSSKDESEKTVEEPLEELEKDDKILYEGMVNLLNIKMEVEEDRKVDLEEIEAIPVEIEAIVMETEENKEIPDEIILDEEMVNLINPQEEEKAIEDLHKNSSKELKTEAPGSEGKEEIKSELLTQNITKQETKSESNELVDDLLVDKDESSLKMNQVFSEEKPDEFEDTNQNSTTKSDSKYELVNASADKENQEVKNESFGPFIKEGVEFSSDQAIEADAAIVEPKEVVKQIVDQVKFDLSESKNQMKLTLKPESLGEMTMNVELAKDGIIAKIMVDNYRTKEIIEGNLFQLKEGIKDTGMEIKTVEVFVGQGSDFDKHNFNQANGFNLNQNSKKLRIKAENTKGVKDYEDGIVEDKTRPQNYTAEGGLNLFA